MEKTSQPTLSLSEKEAVKAVPYGYWSMDSFRQRMDMRLKKIRGDDKDDLTLRYSEATRRQNISLKQ